MATKHTDECLRKAAINEPIFVLRAQDKLAPMLVRLWAQAAEIAGCPSHKCDEAMDLADAMEVWPNRKFPD